MQCHLDPTDNSSRRGGHVVIESCIMGDKFRSEIQKPVKNPLLSGAGHGFPFENFQGSSLLVPVSQDSPSVLNDGKFYSPNLS